MGIYIIQTELQYLSLFGPPRIQWWIPSESNVLKQNLALLGITVNVNTVSTGSIIGDLASNVDNIARTGVILYTSTADDFGFVLDNVLPGPAIYLIAPVSGYTWEWPAVGADTISEQHQCDRFDRQSIAPPEIFLQHRSAQLAVSSFDYSCISRRTIRLQHREIFGLDHSSEQLCLWKHDAESELSCSLDSGGIIWRAFNDEFVRRS